MAGMGPAPKADADRRRANAPTFGWTVLPAARPGPAPELPPVREWSAETERWWAALWSKPQATQWDQSGMSAVPMAILYEDIQSDPDARAAALLGELRQHEDRHGLNPKAMLQLRWLLAADVVAVEAKPPPAKRKSAGPKVPARFRVVA